MIKKMILGKKIKFTVKTMISLSSRLIIRGKDSSLELSEIVDIKENCKLDAVNGRIILKDHVFINRNSIIVAMNYVEIGSHTCIGPNLVIYDHDHDYKRDINLYKTAPVIIGSNVWIGANCTILKGVTIGDNSIIAAGSVVYCDVPSNSIFYQKKSNVIKNRLE